MIQGAALLRQGCFVNQNFAVREASSHGSHLKLGQPKLISIRHLKREFTHSTSRVRRKASSKPRPVIAKFSFYQDKEFVWSFVKNLKGSGIGISNDFPKEIDEIHEKLYPILKKAKQDRQSAYFKVDKLIINGQVYRGKETEDLLHYGAIM